MTRLQLLLGSERYKSKDELPEWVQQRETYSEQIRSIRELMGMTQEQLARRASQQPRLIRRLESGKDSDPQLSTLLKTAEGLECVLVVQFVPKKSLPQLLQEKALEKARKMIQLSKGTAALEEQEPEEKFIEWKIQAMVEDLLKKPSSLWED